MDTIVLIIIIAAVVLVALAAGAWFFSQKKQTERLRGSFGSEYDRTVEEYGTKGKAESELKGREKRVREYDIRPLTAAEHERFAKSWASCQARFVDDPTAAVGEADRLVRDLMGTRGYPVGDFDRQAADVSVTYPTVVENYRAADAIAERNAAGDATTEDLRQAMVHYRSLFGELLETGATEPEAAEARR
jgi:hypothetical protein